MVTVNFYRTMVGILLTIVFISGAFAQQHNEYPDLKKYSRWGFVFGPVLYNKAKTSTHYGDYTIKNKPIWGFNAGFEYIFHPDKKWSFVTGFIVALEPIYNFDYKFKDGDIFPQFDEEDLMDSATEYAILTYSVPLLIRLNLKVNKKVYINFLSGIKLMFFPHGTAEFTVSYTNANNTESREVFGLRVESPDNAIQGSFIVGTGVSLAIRKMLLKTNLVYVMNFQNTFEGEYQFDNLLTSPPSRGDYKLSGNYVGLLFAINLLKKNKDNIEE
jgi:hypothetical protein